jgi:two-component system, NarL family, response regulator NreC
MMQRVAMSISVVVADDHQIVRLGLRALLESEPGISVVGEASDGAEALDAVARLAPDVLVLDLIMPGIAGFDVLKRLAELKAPTRVVIFSMHASESYVVDALRLGAIGYVVKDSSASELVHAIRETAEGRRFLSSPLSSGGIDALLDPLASKDPYDALTTREREVLRLSAQGLTNPQIGRKLSISPRTAETHRANLLRKLSLKGQKDLIRFALKRGIVDL